MIFLLGQGLTDKLAKSGHTVIIVGRDKGPDSGMETLRRLRHTYPEGKHEFVPCDATNIADIRSSCDVIQKKVPYINQLILSQGMMAMNGRDETREGLDKKLALHYYGRIEFIRRLLPFFSDNTRVMSVLSAGVHGAFMHEDDLDLKKRYSLVNAANLAGFYNDLALDELSHQYPHHSFIHAAPGVVKTELGKDLPFPVNQLFSLLKIFIAKEPEACAAALSPAMLGDKCKEGFHLVNEFGGEALKTTSHNDIKRQQIWKHTTDLLDSVK